MAPAGSQHAERSTDPQRFSASADVWRIVQRTDLTSGQPIVSFLVVKRFIVMQIAFATLIALVLCSSGIAAQEIEPLPLPARVRILAPPLLKAPTIGTATYGSQYVFGLALADHDTLEIPINAIRFTTQ